MTDKSDLLNQLKIDRTAESPRSGAAPGWYLAAGVAIAMVGLGGGYFMMISPPEPPVAVAAKSVEKPVASPSSTASDSNAASASEVAPTVPKSASPASTSVLNASGYITARRIATVSAEVMGLITKVAVEEGMEVEAGQILAQLDDTLPKVNLELAEAQVNVLRSRLVSINANLAEARRVLSRTTELKVENFSSEASVTRAQTEVDSLLASIESTKADIKAAELGAKYQRERLMDHTIRAPFAGVVTVKNAQEGEIVSPSSAGGGFTRTGICTIVDMDSLEIEVDVNEAYIGRVFAKQTVEAQLDAYPDWKIPASVIAIIPTADRAKATVKVRISIDVKDTRILPDMGVKVAFMKA